MIIKVQLPEVLGISAVLIHDETMKKVYMTVPITAALVARMGGKKVCFFSASIAGKDGMSLEIEEPVPDQEW